jgi:long-chain acyl-CoA synthetase
MKKINIVETIKSETLKYRNNIAIKDGNTVISYEELFSLVNQLTAEFEKKGIVRNSIIAIQYPDSYTYIIICLAILSLDAVIAPASVSMPKNELDELITKLGVNYLITHMKENNTDINFSEQFSNFHIGVVQYKTSKPEYYTELCSINPAFIRFSSGTTEKSKGVLLSHQAVIERTDAANSALQITQEDIIIWLLNMSYHFVVTILLFLRKAATIVMCGRQFPQSLLEELKNNNYTFI